MPNRNGKPRVVTGEELETLRHAWNAMQQAKAMTEGCYARWLALGTAVAKRHRIPPAQVDINLKTGEVTRKRA